MISVGLIDKDKTLEEYKIINVISVGLIDKDKTLEEYKDDTMTVIPTTCDRETKSAGKSLVQFHDFVCMNFPSYRDNLDSSDEEQKLVCPI